MKEFGSDFHYIESIPDNEGIRKENWRKGIYFANGRQALNGLISHKKWGRIWLPSYFCYDVINSVSSTGIKIEFYDDYPGNDDNHTITNCKFKPKDVLLRVNYFGLRSYRDNSSLGLDIEVIEDHTHSLSGDWIENSNADWCIASLRKSLPVGEGGVLWSPKGNKLPDIPPQNSENIELASARLHGMKLKSSYLSGTAFDKEAFRKIFIQTENAFEKIPLSQIYVEDSQIISKIDLNKWNMLKKRNWEVMYKNLQNDFDILIPENDKCIPFSFIIRCQEIRQLFIENQIFPAILWPVPDIYNKNLLSIHCDGRYSVNDIEEMVKRIKKCLRLLE